MRQRVSGPQSVAGTVRFRAVRDERLDEQAVVQGHVDDDADRGRAVEIYLRPSRPKNSPTNA